jgi:quercetin dioxygenase-like cupin family protein
MAAPFAPAVRLCGQQTGGALSVMENAVPARWDGPPLHHHAFDETFYVLEGELTFQVRDELFTAGRGALAFAPGGVVHTFANLGDAPARYLLLCTPAGFEGYFARLAAQAAGTEPPSWALAPTPPVTTVGGRIGERDDVAIARPIAPAEGPLSVLVGSEQSDGRIAVMENRIPAGAAGPSQRSRDVDELFWVLDGELTLRLGAERIVRRTGEMAFAPHGVNRAFASHGDDEARTLIVCTPARS